MKEYEVLVQLSKEQANELLDKGELKWQGKIYLVPRKNKNE
jgi:hypothetical protein